MPSGLMRMRGHVGRGLLWLRRGLDDFRSNAATNRRERRANFLKTLKRTSQLYRSLESSGQIPTRFSNAVIRKAERIVQDINTKRWAGKQPDRNLSRKEAADLKAAILESKKIAKQIAAEYELARQDRNTIQREVNKLQAGHIPHVFIGNGRSTEQRQIALRNWSDFLSQAKILVSELEKNHASVLANQRVFRAFLVEAGKK